MWALNLGLTVHVNPIPPITSSKFVKKFLTKDLEKIMGGKVLVGTNPKPAAEVMVDHIRKKRKALFKI